MIINIDPVAFSLGQLDIRWYSLMYVFAFVTIYLLLLWRIKNDPLWQFPGKTRPQIKNLVTDLVFLSFLGAIIGGRIGYAILYNFGFFVHNPLALVSPFENGKFVGLYGMSFHGGLIGAILFAYIFCKKKKLDFFGLADFLVPAIPLGYFWGRIGNFLGGEILGKHHNGFFSVQFASDLSGLPRYPVQLFEAFGEGILIFLVLWLLRNKKNLQGKFLGLYLFSYGMIRFLLEFFREPTNLALFGLTTAQLLCLCMIIIGVYFIKLKTDASISR